MCHTIGSEDLLGIFRSVQSWIALWHSINLFTPLLSAWKTYTEKSRYSNQKMNPELRHLTCIFDIKRSLYSYIFCRKLKKASVKVLLSFGLLVNQTLSAMRIPERMSPMIRKHLEKLPGPWYMPTGSSPWNCSLKRMQPEYGELFHHLIYLQCTLGWNGLSRVLKLLASVYCHGSKTVQGGIRQNNVQRSSIIHIELIAHCPNPPRWSRHFYNIEQYWVKISYDTWHQPIVECEI